MIKLSDSEIDKAFKRWLIKTGRIHRDKLLKPFLSDEIHPWEMGQDGWLKQTRVGLRHKAQKQTANFNFNLGKIATSGVGASLAEKMRSAKKE